MHDTARVIAQPTGNASDLWNPKREMHNRFQEIEALTHLAQMRIEQGHFPAAQRSLQAIRELASEGRQLGGAA